MSDKRKLPRALAIGVAREIVAALQPACMRDRIIVAGSLRRRKEEVGDACSQPHFPTAWEAWIEGDEGTRCTTPTTLNAPAMQARYLKNRLWRAFAAGWNAARHDAAEYKRLYEQEQREKRVALDAASLLAGKTVDRRILDDPACNTDAHRGAAIRAARNGAAPEGEAPKGRSGMNARQAYNLRAIVVGALHGAGYSLADIVPTLRLRSKEDARKLLARGRRIQSDLVKARLAHPSNTEVRHARADSGAAPSVGPSPESRAAPER